MASKSFPFAPRIIISLECVGTDYITMTVVCQWVAPAKLLKHFLTALKWIAQNKLHINDILHLLDDFLIISPTEDLCRKQLDLLLLLCSYLGMPMAPEKTVGPSQIILFAGIELIQS